MARCALIADFFARQFPRDFLLLFFSFFFSRSKHHGRFIKGLACYYYSFGFRTARNEQSGGVIVFKREQIIASIHASRENTSIDAFSFFLDEISRVSQALRQMGEQDSSDRTEESRTRTTENQIGSLL